DRILKRIDVDHHDMGFLYSPSCVAAYKLTGSEEGKEAALLAADNLISRFQPTGQFIQAWGELGAEDNYRLIIDCLLNLPLLFWATEESGKAIYRDIALKHIDTAMRVIIRDDDSTYHTYYFDTKTGEPTKGVTRQGYRDGSAWARGQAWGIYGSALAYRYTSNPKYFDLFERMTKFFLDHLPSDKVPYWDFDFTDGSDEPKDSSASAIAICGMHEMAKYLDEDKAKFYRSEAEGLLLVLIDACAATEPSASNGLLLHGTYARKSPYNPCNNRGVDECNTWGDYFYLEALMRFSKDWDSYW
ncbi:MAG: glucoronyl hydrolase, partial [Spirochaetia bacterium]|nr:glucoronyl hydrolase [Spirochaetia bacterium]